MYVLASFSLPMFLRISLFVILSLQLLLQNSISVAAIFLLFFLLVTYTSASQVIILCTIVLYIPILVFLVICLSHRLKFSCLIHVLVRPNLTLITYSVVASFVTVNSKNLNLSVPLIFRWSSISKSYIFFYCC